MRIYFLASQANLEAFKNHLPSKFKNVQIYGSNDYDEAVQEVLRRAPVNPYDAVIFTRVVDIMRDVSVEGVTSQNLLDSMKLSLKGKQVFFLVPSGRKEIIQPLSSFFTVPNARLFKYDGKMNMSVIETAMKEAVLLHDTDGKDTSLLQESLHQTIKTSVGNNGYLKHVVSLGIKATDKMSILSKYIKETTETFEKVTVEDRAGTLSKIKDKIMTNTTDVSEALTSSVEDVVNITTKAEPLVVFEDIGSVISEEELQETLYETDKDYQALAEVKTAMDLAVENLKQTKENPTMTLDLMQDRIQVVNKMKEIEVTYLNELTTEVANVTVTRFTAASGLVKFKMQDLAELANNNDLRHIELLKEARDNFVERVNASSATFSDTVDSLRDSIQTSGRNYVAMINNLEKEMLEFANETDNMLPALDNKNKDILESLQTTYVDTARTFVDIGSKANDLIYGFQTIIKIDEDIINKQTQVIGDLVTGNVKKVISVGGILEAKSIMVVGGEGSGKTAIATNIATNYAKKGHNVLVFDLDLETPSLQYYGNEELIGYAFTVSEGNLDFKFTSNNRLSFVMSSALVPEGKQLDVDNLLQLLKEQENKFDRVVYIIPDGSELVKKVQPKCKSTVYVATSDIVSMGRAYALADSLLNQTPLNTVVVNKCSQPMMEIVKTKLPLQIRNIAVIPCLHFNKFDLYKSQNLIPSRESSNFETTGYEIVSSID